MKKYIVVLMMLCLLVPVFAQNPGVTGSAGLLHTHSGNVLVPGRLQIMTNMNFFTKLGEFVGSSTLKPDDFSAANYWLVAGNLAASYGISEHFDATVSMRLYQDTHYANEFNLPDDIFLQVKAGSFEFGRRRFHAAIIPAVRIGLGEVHNYPFAEYASGGFEYGFFGAISYFTDPYFLERSLSIHFNLGWWNHNEAGRTFKLPNDVEREATVNSNNMQMALAAVIPTAEFEFRFELAGILYFTQPDPFIYSAEEWAYFSPSVRYKPSKWISMDLGMDFRVSPSDRQWTTGVPDISTNLDLPKNYPPWKVHMGVNFYVDMPGTTSSAAGDMYEVNRTSPDVQKRAEFYRTLQEEQKRSEDIQDELDQLRREREKAQEEIDKLRDELEGEP